MSRPRGKSLGWASLVIVLLTGAAYGPALRAGFIWDDDDHLTANPAVAAPDGLQRIWSSLRVSRYYPLTLTSFWLQHKLWGLNPKPYHAVNVALHAINGVLLFLVLRRLAIPAAWLGALLWTLHPVNVESVAWITELKNTQSGLFFFCAVLWYLRFEAAGRRRWYLLAVAGGAAAVLSKPSTVVLPVVLLLCVWWEKGRWRAADFVRVAPFFAWALGMSALTVLEQRGHIERQGEAEWLLPFSERLIIAGKNVWFYAGKILWPVNLAFVYPRWEVPAVSVLSRAGLIAAAAVSVWLWRSRQQPWARAGLFGAGYFVTALLPVLGFFDVFYFRYSFVADHFQYLAGPGLVALAAAGAARGLSRCRLDRARSAVGAVAVLTLAGLTWRQAHIYRDSETLWRDTVKKNPNSWMAQNLLGSALLGAGKPAEAIAHFERALQIKPDYAWAHNNLGVAFQRTGRSEEAIRHHQQAVRLKPDYLDAWYNLGIILDRTGQSGLAIECYEQALRINPDDAAVHNNLGSTLMRAGRRAQAVQHWQRALRLKPDFAEAHNNLGAALMQDGQLAGAIEHFRQALKLRPDYATAHCNLAAALELSGNTKDAITHYAEALRLKPDLAEAEAGLTRLQAATKP